MRWAHKDSHFECTALDSVHCWSTFAMSSQSHYKPKGDLLDPEGTLSTCLPRQAITLANKAVEKTIMDKGLGKKRGQHFIFMVRSLVCSKHFHTPPCRSKSWASKLTLPCACVRNFSIENCHCPSTSTIQKFITWKNLQPELLPIYGTWIQPA